MSDPRTDLTLVRQATDRLSTTLAGLSDAQLADPSSLPGWTRGHVLTHLSRNADGLVNLLTWARTGVPTEQYVSGTARDADIEAGAARGLAEQVADLTTSAERFAAAAELTDEQWAGPVRFRGGGERPASVIPWGRLMELEIHHVDLNLGYGAGDWPVPFAERLLADTAASMADQATTCHLRDIGSSRQYRLGDAGEGDPVVSGPAGALAAWLVGRDPGAALTVTPAGPLPELPAWK